MLDDARHRPGRVHRDVSRFQRCGITSRRPRPGSRAPVRSSAVTQDAPSRSRPSSDQAPPRLVRRAAARILKPLPRNHFLHARRKDTVLFCPRRRCDDLDRQEFGQITLPSNPLRTRLLGCFHTASCFLDGAFECGLVDPVLHRAPTEAMPLTKRRQTQPAAAPLVDPHRPLRRPAPHTSHGRPPRWNSQSFHHRERFGRGKDRVYRTEPRRRFFDGVSLRNRFTVTLRSAGVDSPRIREGVSRS